MANAEEAITSAWGGRDDRTEQEMIADIAARAEKWLLEDGGPFFVLWSYFATGQYRYEIDAVMRQHGQSPAWRRAEAKLARGLGIERSVIRLRYRMR
jgi:hypothetical protein